MSRPRQVRIDRIAVRGDGVGGGPAPEALRQALAARLGQQLPDGIGAPDRAGEVSEAVATRVAEQVVAAVRRSRRAR